MLIFQDIYTKACLPLELQFICISSADYSVFFTSAGEATLGFLHTYITAKFKCILINLAKIVSA